MKFLLDSGPFLWLLLDSPRLSQACREAIGKPENEVFLSVISAWEVVVKYSLGKLPLPESPEHYLPAQRRRHGIATLPMDEESALHVVRLPQIHRDPFDRMLICQALVHGLTILTPDEMIRQYPVRTIW